MNEWGHLQMNELVSFSQQQGKTVTASWGMKLYSSAGEWKSLE